MDDKTWNCPDCETVIGHVNADNWLILVAPSGDGSTVTRYELFQVTMRCPSCQQLLRYCQPPARFEALMDRIRANRREIERLETKASLAKVE